MSFLRKRAILAVLSVLGLFFAGKLAAIDFYWENPAPFIDAAARFPVSDTRGGLSAVVWQESSVVEDAALSVRLSIAIKKSGGSWRIKRNFAGPYLFVGSEPAIASVAVGEGGKIAVVVSASAGAIDVFSSEDEGGTFSRAIIGGVSAISESEGSVAPRIHARSDGGYLLFVTKGTDQSLSIFLSRSDDGREWSSFVPFVIEEGLRLNFLPTHATIGGKDFVIFQSLSNALRPSFQLYLKRSSDSGVTWSEAVLVTDFRDGFAQTRVEADAYDNQRPQLSAVGDALFLAWERRTGSLSPQIYITELSEDGKPVSEPERVTNAGAYCNNPVISDFKGEPLLFWFDNRRGQNRVYLAQRQGILWQDYDLSGSRADAAFARPAVDSDGLYVFWQASTRGGSDRLYVLRPDKSVDPPALLAENFTSGKRVRRDTARISWKAPDDSSGVAAYSLSWSMDGEVVPPSVFEFFPTVTSAERVADEDGSWYFSITAQDYAGNWSEPATLEFVRDTTPPGRVNIVMPQLDQNGYLLSNSFSLSWNPPPASDLAGYSWDLEYVAPLDYLRVLERRSLSPTSPSLPVRYDFETAAALAFGSKDAPRVMLGNALSADFVNRDDGIWRFTVAAVDEVGNIGESSSRYFRTDKYVPYTYITLADASRDDLGVLTMRLVGRGFSEGGRVERVFLDRDGRAPYDREFLLSRGEFRIESDRVISGLRVEDLEEGRYRIGLVHPERGLYITAPLINVDSSGTIKFGDYSKTWEPSWVNAIRRRFVLDSTLLLMGAIVLFGLLGAYASLRGIGGVLQESIEIQTEVQALITGELMPSEKKRRVSGIKKRGGGLSFKLASFTTGLVVVVVVLVSVPLSLLMTRTQEQTLVRGLKDRSRVLLESLASGARAYLPSQNVLELGFLPAQTVAVPEALYATITGFGSDATTFSDHVWATNDPEIAAKVDTADYQAGISRIEDSLSPRLASIAKELDDRARTEVGALSAGIAELTQEGLKLALRTDAESVRRRDDIQTTTRELETRLTERLAFISGIIGSEPAFGEDLLPSGINRFIFFKPVMYRQGAEDVYFRGLVRLEVSTDSIVSAMVAGRIDLLKITGAVALLAVLMGVIGALVLASLIVRPLKRLVDQVKKISETEDKAKLEGQDIKVKSRDEIATLGDTINEMTHGLVKAAKASADLTVGKEVQKMFIPLDTDSMGRKLTSGKKDFPKVEFFGYYEGAKGVSGDYFDYLKLDERFFALIKCDVAGKGVPAALIMIEVATLFLSFFKGWKPTPEGKNLSRLVYQINDFLEERGFKGRFAAFTLCLFDTNSGDLTFCNAGDNLVHIFDAAAGSMKLITLPATPTAGVFTNPEIEEKSGYPMQTLRLNPGDILLLYSDGIEEAKRKFRDGQLNELLYWKGDDAYTLATESASRAVGTGDQSEQGIPDEELGADRVADLLNTVYTRGRYELKKVHNPDPDERFTFDFSDSDGSAEAGIMAMVSVEKIFRLFRDPKAGDDNLVLVDRKVDEFLKKHFAQYRTYCARTKEHPQYSEYLYYTHVKEDEQYDDLTILGVRKK